MTDRFELVPFEGHQIMTVRVDDEVFVVMKPIVEALGLVWRTQHERIVAHPVIAEGIRLSLIPSVGGVQDMLTLNLEAFHGWLVTLESRRIADEARRATVVQYQKRAFRAIFEHFHGRLGERPALPPPASHIAIENQVLNLIRRLRGMTDRLERGVAYGMLEKACGVLGIDCPALSDMGHEEPQPADILTEFWNAIAELERRGFAIDHSRRGEVLAFSPRELNTAWKAASVDFQWTNELRHVIRQSEPRFIAAKTVNSRRPDTVLHCWVFSRVG